MSKAEKNLQKMIKEANGRHANMRKAMNKVYDAPVPKTKKPNNNIGDYTSFGVEVVVTITEKKKSK